MNGRRIRALLEAASKIPHVELPAYFTETCIDHGGTFIPEPKIDGGWQCDSVASVRLLEVYGEGDTTIEACINWIHAARRSCTQVA